MIAAVEPREYRLSRTGVIQNPGMFEGCMLWVPYFWDIALDGLYDELPGGVMSVSVEKDDKDYFASLVRDNRDPTLDQPLREVARMIRRRRRIRLVQRDDGFVCEA
jgi:hypothetical protein